MATDDTIIGLRAAAECAGTTVGRLRGMVERKEIPARRIKGRLRFDVADLENIADEPGERAPTQRPRPARAASPPRQRRSPGPDGRLSGDERELYSFLDRGGQPRDLVLKYGLPPERAEQVVEGWQRLEPTGPSAIEQDIAELKRRLRRQEREVKRLTDAVQRIDEKFLGLCGIVGLAQLREMGGPGAEILAKEITFAFQQEALLFQQRWGRPPRL